MEECLKLADPAAAVQLEALRYRTYTLAKAWVTTADSQQRMEAARLYVLVDGKGSECEFAEQVTTLIRAGVDVIQFRDKSLDDRTLLSRARLLRRVIDESSVTHHLPLTTYPPPDTSHEPLLIINDRPDIAVLARADGVHVGQEELPVHEVRQIVGTEMLIGVSTHTIEQARQAVLDGANYIGCGPVFPSATKQFDHFPGLEFLRQVAEEIALPAFAIGGITLQNVPQVFAAGSQRVAVRSAAEDAGGFARALAANLAADEPAQGD
jgi:thiamine-phosphate pyrophosphorylase